MVCVNEKESPFRVTRFYLIRFLVAPKPWEKPFQRTERQSITTLSLPVQRWQKWDEQKGRQVATREGVRVQTTGMDWNHVHHKTENKISWKYPHAGIGEKHESAKWARRPRMWKIFTFSEFSHFSMQWCLPIPVFWHLSSGSSGFYVTKNCHLVSWFTQKLEWNCNFTQL